MFDQPRPFGNREFIERKYSEMSDENGGRKSAVHAEWIIAVCHSTVGDTLIPNPFCVSSLEPQWGAADAETRN